MDPNSPRKSLPPENDSPVSMLSRTVLTSLFAVKLDLITHGDRPAGPGQVLVCATRGKEVVQGVMRPRSAFAVALFVTVATLPSFTATAGVPHNGRIAFARLPSDQIFTMAPNGTDLTRLTLSKMPNWVPAWSADGTKIAFVRAKAGWTGSKLMLMSADGSGTSEAVRVEAEPAGTRLVPRRRAHRHVSGCERHRGEHPGDDRGDRWLGRHPGRAGPAPPALRCRRTER